MKRHKYFQLSVSLRGKKIEKKFPFLHDEYEVISATIYGHNFPRITIELDYEMFKLLKKLGVIEYSDTDKDGVFYYTSKIFTEV